MKISSKSIAAIERDAEASEQRKRLAVIEYDRPKPKLPGKGEYETLKLFTAPGDANNTTTYEFALRYFRTGTPEEWLLYKADLKKAIHGLHLTTGPQRYSLARRVLKGAAYTCFDNNAKAIGTETVDHFEDCLKALTKHFFPARAAAKQKRYMRRQLRKPHDVTMREYVSRVTEMNNYFQDYPIEENGNPPPPIPDDEMMDNLEYGTPRSWQRQMLIGGHDPFVELCERNEEAELESTNKSASKPKGKTAATTSESGNKRKKPNGAAKKKRPFWCKLCGPNETHTTNGCDDLEPQIRAMKGQDKAVKSGPAATKRFYQQRKEEAKLFQSFVAYKREFDKNEKAKKRRVGKKKEDSYVFDEVDEHPDTHHEEEHNYLKQVEGSDYEPHSEVEYDSDSSA